MSTQPDLFSNTAINPSGGQAALEYRKEMRVDTPVNTVKPTVVEQIIQQETATRKVSKIMVFYSDNTFDTFVSEKNKKECDAALLLKRLHKRYLMRMDVT